MLRDNILDDILSKVAWDTSASTYQMIVDDLKGGKLTGAEFKEFLKAVCVEWGNRVEDHYILENDYNSEYD